MFCKYCGKEFEGVECPSCNPVNIKETPDSEDLALSLFLESDEKLLSILKKGYFRNYILEDSISKDYLILSNRRVYYSGTYFGRIGGIFSKSVAQVIFPLEKISSILFLVKKPIWTIFFTMFFAFFGGVILVLDINSRRLDLVLFWLFFWGVSFGFFVLHNFLTERVFVLTSSDSSSIQISFTLYGEKAIREFANQTGKALTAIRKGNS